MKIALAQLSYHVGNFEGNVAKIKATIQKAKESGAELVIFAELSVSGYPPRDFLEFDDFIDKCQKAVTDIATKCKGIAAIIGTPTLNPEFEGKDLYNSACFLYDGMVRHVRHKTLLPNYDVFDEYRYFEPNKKWEVIEFKGQKIALTICEDLWNVGNDPMYTVNPMDKLAENELDLMINIAASPFNYNQHQVRTDVLRENARMYHLPLFYVNHVGAQTELLFDGGSMVIDANGKIIHELNYFEEDFLIVDTFNMPSRQCERQYHKYPSDQVKVGLIHDALIMGIKTYFHKLGFSKAILGLSGGIDSAVTLALAIQALGNENVISVLMPSQYSSGHSVDDSLEMLKNTGSPHHLININDAHHIFRQTLKPVFGNPPNGLTDENIQARIRGIYLMALANKHGYILLNTSNKSEAAVGYGTLYGDMNGGISVLGDVYKTEVFELARYINRNGEIIPHNIITKPPSAELRPNQKDSDSLPDYNILDKILFQYIEQRKGPKELIAMGFDEELVKRTLKLVNTNEYKRYQTPPILRISPKAFGMGRRMPIVAKYLG
jgi:NAD+ synthase (glutamine-hydrolysing)